jgi:hypothetical protein
VKKPTVKRFKSRCGLTNWFNDNTINGGKMQEEIKKRISNIKCIYNKGDNPYLISQLNRIEKILKDARPYLWVYAQDNLPLKLQLDSGQSFDVLSGGQSHHVVINYTIVKPKRGRKPKNRLKEQK